MPNTNYTAPAIMHSYSHMWKLILRIFHGTYMAIWRTNKLFCSQACTLWFPIQCTLGIVDAVEVFSVNCFSLSTHTSPYIYSSQLPLEVLTNVNMRVPVTANRVTCVTLGREDNERCGGGALPPGPLLVERVFTKNWVCCVWQMCVHVHGLSTSYTVDCSELCVVGLK